MVYKQHQANNIVKGVTTLYIMTLEGLAPDFKEIDLYNCAAAGCGMVWWYHVICFPLLYPVYIIYAPISPVRS